MLRLVPQEQHPQCQGTEPGRLSPSCSSTAQLVPVPGGSSAPARPHPILLPLQILERTLEPDSSDEEPPPVYSPPAYESQALGTHCPRAPPTPPPR